MKKIIVIAAAVICGANMLMAAELEELKASANNALTATIAKTITAAGVLPEPAATAADPSMEDKVGVFQGRATWTGSNGFSALKQLGIRKSAEEDAVAKCQLQGLLGCVAIGSVIGSCGTYECGATATAVQLVPVSGAVVFSADSEWTGSNGFSALEQLGIRKSAEERAIAKCQTLGLLGCVAIGSTIGSCGTYECSATGRAQLQTNPK